MMLAGAMSPLLGGVLLVRSDPVTEIAVTLQSLNVEVLYSRSAEPPARQVRMACLIVAVLSSRAFQSLGVAIESRAVQCRRSITAWPFAAEALMLNSLSSSSPLCFASIDGPGIPSSFRKRVACAM